MLEYVERKYDILHELNEKFRQYIVVEGLWVGMQNNTLRCSFVKFHETTICFISVN